MEEVATPEECVCTLKGIHDYPPSPALGSKSSTYESLRIRAAALPSHICCSCLRWRGGAIPQLQGPGDPGLGLPAGRVGLGWEVVIKRQRGGKGDGRAPILNSGPQIQAVL